MTRRVVVTGIGCVTPLGNDVETVWNALLEAKSGVGPITHFDAKDFPTTFAAEVKDFDFDRIVARLTDRVERFDYAGRNIRFAIGAAAQAVDDSGLSDAVAAGTLDPSKFGVYLGAGEGAQDFNLFMGIIAGSETPDGEFDLEHFTKMSLERMNPHREVEQEPNMPAGHLAGLFDAQGPNLNCLTACAASSQAIGEAVDLIRRGDADAMLSGGAHSMIHPFGVTGFNLLTALSTRNEAPTEASRPFDIDRDGFVLGEGSGMLVLEELEHAKARGASIYGEILGYGSSADAYRITDIPPDGRGAIRAINMALGDASLQPEDIDYVNAHGTSTQVNDKVETHAVQETFGEHAAKTPMSSIKSMLGHLIAAAGSVEAITCLLAIRHNKLPPTINYTNPDPNCPLDYVPNEARDANVRHCLSNSFGFGGQNVSLVVGEYTGD